MAQIHITDIEAAINFWRQQSPAVDGLILAAPTSTLASLYAMMVFCHESWVEESTLSADAMSAWLTWYATTPDTPCIAICSTSQGDDVCKGCGRTLDEITQWTQFSPVEKREVWYRLLQKKDAWRFGRYAERVLDY